MAVFALACLLTELEETPSLTLNGERPLASVRLLEGLGFLFSLPLLFIGSLTLQAHYYPMFFATHRLLIYQL